MRALTVISTDRGWAVQHGRIVLCYIAQTVLADRLGLRPTRETVIEAVREHAPGYGVTDSTPIEYPALPAPKDPPAEPEYVSRETAYGRTVDYPFALKVF